MQEHKKEQRARYLEYGAAGMTYDEIGVAEGGITRQRVQQVVRQLIPDWRDRFPKQTQVRLREQARREKYGSAVDSPREILQAARARFARKRENSYRGKGWEFSIRFAELEWPMKCPYLGIELDYFADERCDNSVSFDRIDPSKGYIKGNVLVCSWRANRIKNDATVDELYKIAKHLDYLQNTLK
jgi:hypothetical protein